MTSIEPSILADVTEGLLSKKASKRRSAAMKIRKLMLCNVGEQLFAALKTKLKDPRAWSSQYQMTLALGIIGHVGALSFLVDLSESEFENSIVEHGIGDAVVRLVKEADDALNYVTNWLSQNKYVMASGGLRALSVRRLAVPELSALQILEAVESAPYGDIGNTLRRAAAAAAVNWPLSATASFLKLWQQSEWNILRNTASDSLRGRHAKWYI